MRVLSSLDAAQHWLRERGVRSLTSDSRRVQAGDGFLAWPGTASDARGFVGAALQQGAAACLIELDGCRQAELAPYGDAVAAIDGLKAASGPLAAAFFGHPSRTLRVLAVTGTNGKTSTAWWLAQALGALPGAHSVPCGVVGTLGIGVPPKLGDECGDAGGSRGEFANVVSTGLTTPDPVQLQQALANFLAQGFRACALEASSIGIEEHRLDGTDVEVALLTNFTQDHLDYHGSMEAYWEAKRRLFGWSGLRSVVLNVDDARGAELAPALRAAGRLDVWTVSCATDARLMARDVVHTAQGLQFLVIEGMQAVPLQSHLIGTYNVSNLLGVLAGLRALGVPLELAVSVAERLRPVPGRMECLGGVGEPLVAVDYAHTPDALEKALKALSPLARGRGGKLWCIFGCGGDRDPSKRPLMGAMAAKGSDWVVVTSDNPRSEKPEAIIAQVLLGLPACTAVEVQADRARAISETVLQAADADVILIAGKGHETTQDIAGVKHPFVDRTHARSALLMRRGTPARAAT